MQLSKYGNSEHCPVSDMCACPATQTLLPCGGHMKHLLLPTLLWASVLRGKDHPSWSGKHVSSKGHFLTGFLVKISSKDIHCEEKICCCCFFPFLKKQLLQKIKILCFQTTFWCSFALHHSETKSSCTAHCKHIWKQEPCALPRQS